MAYESPARPELFDDEKLLSYAKYYYIDPDPLDPLALQCIREPLAEEDVMDPSRVAELFQAGYVQPVMGYYIGEGWSYSALFAPLPGVTIDMLDWWFSWMGVRPPSVDPAHGNLRYKIWNPGLHFDQGPADDATYQRFCDESIPVRLRREESSIVIREKLTADQDGYSEMTAHATPHSALALPKECWEYIDACGTLTVAASDHSVTLQYFRETSHGSELILRNWRGYVLNDEGAIVRMTDPFPTPTKEHIIGDLMHNLTEMPHLAKFLPSLYAEEHTKPIGAY